MSDVPLVVRGDLARFPFADPKQGTFTLAARAQGATLDYAAGWPARPWAPIPSPERSGSGSWWTKTGPCM